MSRIPFARVLIKAVLDNKKLTVKEQRWYLKRALKLMYRETALRRGVPAKRQKIDKAMRRRIGLLMRNTKMTQHQIATKLGLGSSGRVSEVIHGKR